MALVRYRRPNYRHLSKSFNELMDEFFEPINAQITNNFTPRVDVRENEQEFEFLLELPGVRKEDIQIELEEDVLNVSGERKALVETKETNVHRMAQFYGSLQRRFRGKPQRRAGRGCSRPADCRGGLQPRRLCSDVGVRAAAAAQRPGPVGASAACVYGANHAI